MVQGPEEAIGSHVRSNPSNSLLTINSVTTLIFESKPRQTKTSTVQSASHPLVCGRVAHKLGVEPEVRTLCKARGTSEDASVSRLLSDTATVRVSVVVVACLCWARSGSAFSVVNVCVRVRVRVRVRVCVRCVRVCALT